MEIYKAENRLNGLFKITQQYLFIYFCFYLLLVKFKISHKIENGRINTKPGFLKF